MYQYAVAITSLSGLLYNTYMKIDLNAPTRYRWCGVIVPLTAEYVKNQSITFVEIHFASLREMRKLNSRWRSKNYATDVLAFTSEEVGSLIVCESKIMEKNPDLTFRDALMKTVIHGSLHLFGYDHQDDTEAQEMEKLEAEVYEMICGKLGRVGG